MITDIWIENRFGEREKVGVDIAYCEEGDLYQVLGLREHIVNNHAELCTVEAVLNVDKREGYAIHPLTDEAGNYVWYNIHINLVLCLAVGMWG